MVDHFFQEQACELGRGINEGKVSREGSLTTSFAILLKPSHVVVGQRQTQQGSFKLELSAALRLTRTWRQQWQSLYPWMKGEEEDILQTLRFS